MYDINNVPFRLDFVLCCGNRLEFFCSFILLTKLNEDAWRNQINPLKEIYQFLTNNKSINKNNEKYHLKSNSLSTTSSFMVFFLFFV